MNNKNCIYRPLIGMIVIVPLLFALTHLACIDFDDDDDTLPTSTPVITPTATPEGDNPTPTPTATATPTPGAETGTLNIWTSPVQGDIYVDGTWIGYGAWEGDLLPGSYTVSFGAVNGYRTPDEIMATVYTHEITYVEGVYVITFEKKFSMGIGQSVAQTSDGGYIVAGNEGGSGYLLKTDRFGNEMWSKTDNFSDLTLYYSAAQTSDGGYIVTGWTDTADIWYDVILTKTDGLGNELWTKIWYTNSNYYPGSVVQTSDGGYVIAGYTYGYSGVSIFVIKTDGLGNEVWAKTFGGADAELGYSVAQTSDGGYVITGYTKSFGAGGSDVYLIKTDGLGNEVWSKTFGGVHNDSGQSVAQTSDGGYIIAGYTESFGAGNSNVYLVKTNGLGNEVWSKTFGGASADHGYSVTQTNDGGYIIVGYTESSGAGNSDVFLIKTNGLGNKVWSRTFGGVHSDGGQSVAQTNDGAYVITGLADFHSTGSYLYLIKTDQMGNI